MNFNKGVLSIVDPKGRYMGMQHIASAYLTGRCIHISTQGPKDNPTAVVVEVYAEEERYAREEDRTYTRTKGDYNANANPDMFGVLMYKAAKSFNIDREYHHENTYRILDNNGSIVKVSPEEFYTETCDFSTCKKWMTEENVSRRI